MAINKIKNDTIPDSEITAVKLNQSGATDGQAMVWSNSNSQWEPGTVSGGISNILEDTTPQLGGNLDLNGNTLTNDTSLTFTSSTSDAYVKAYTASSNQGARGLTIGSISENDWFIERSASSNDLKFYYNPSVRFQMGSSGQLGIGGANYGTAGQVLTSGGPSAAPSWQAGGGGDTDILTITTTSSNPSAPSSGSVNIYEDGSTLTFQNSRAGTGHYQMKMENSAGTFLFGVDGLGNAVTGTTGSVRTKYFYSVTNTSYYMDPSSTGTALQLAGNIKTDGSYIGNIIEESIAASSTSGGINFYVKTYQIMRFTQAQTANRTLNITGDVSTTLDSHLVNDQFVSIAVAFKNGGTPYYINSVTIDGASVTPKWSGGSAPTGGNASSDDFYTFSIVKTGSATFEVYGTFTQFA
tara:strand:- start:102 stop:1331 length:1230 start_codon:yes stop_codon:yes gene_type:complete